MSDEQKRRKTSSVRHTRAIQRDRSKHPSGPTPDEEVQSRLEELIQPKLYAQARMYADLGLRQLILTLPLMMAFVLSLIWRQIGSVGEAVRELNRRGLLWSRPTKVSQQAVSQRLGSFPAELFHRVLIYALVYRCLYHLCTPTRMVNIPMSYPQN
jgi:hypothetical protein